MRPQLQSCKEVFLAFVFLPVVSLAFLKPNIYNRLRLSLFLWFKFLPQAPRGITTLLGGIVLELAPRKWGFLSIGVGDCKAFAYHENSVGDFIISRN
jgi:hypothetical protein